MRCRGRKVSAIGIVLYIAVHAAVSVSLLLQRNFVEELKQVQRRIVLTGTRWR